MASNQPRTVKSEKYIHVHRYVDTGRWGAWHRDPMGSKARLYFGTHLTENLAARCQDRALLKFKSVAVKPIVLNFSEEDYHEDEELRQMLTNEEFIKLLSAESRDCYKRVEPTPCLRKFLAEEEALQNLPKTKKTGHHFTQTTITPLKEYLKEVVQSRRIWNTSNGTRHYDDDARSERRYEPRNKITRVSRSEQSPVPARAPEEFPELKWTGKRSRSKGREESLNAASESLIDHLHAPPSEPPVDALSAPPSEPPLNDLIAPPSELHVGDLNVPPSGRAASIKNQSKVLEAWGPEGMDAWFREHKQSIILPCTS